MNYMITAYVATAVLWMGYFLWLGRRIRRARDE